MSILASITCADDGTLRTFDVQPDAIIPVAQTLVGKGIAALAVDETGTRGFCGTKEPKGIAAVWLDESTGAWQKVGHTDTDVAWTYLTRSGDARFLLGVSYSGGVARVWPIEDEVLGEPTCEVALANPHCVVTLDEFVYIVSLGSELVAQYRLTESGHLVELDSPSVAAPEGSGPRHLAVAPDARNLYLVTEFSGEVIRLERGDDGQLAVREARSIIASDRGLTHSRFGADPAAEHLIWGADVWLHGNFLVASERSESTLAVLPVGEDGTLGEQVCIVGTEQQPRGFAVSSDGLVVCPGEKSEQVSLFRLDGAGQLTFVGRAPSGLGGNWVRLLER